MYSPGEVLSRGKGQVVVRSGKRKAERGVEGCKRARRGLERSSNWCPLGEGDEGVRVATGLRQQRTRPRSPGRLSSAVRALTKTVGGGMKAGQVIQVGFRKDKYCRQHTVRTVGNSSTWDGS